MNPTALTRRRPTHLAVAIWAAQAAAGASDTLDESVEGFAEVLPLLPLPLRRDQPARHPEVDLAGAGGGGLVLVFGLQALDLVSPAAMLPQPASGPPVLACGRLSRRSLRAALPS